jgi:transketolase
MVAKVDTKEVFVRKLIQIAEKRKEIVVLDGDLSGSTKTSLFGEKYPERFIDCGISEMNMMDMAAGLASCGLMPIVSTFAVFASMKACEQVRTFICYPNLNVKIFATYAGIDVGEAGPTHQAIEDIAIMRSFPNMTVISPSDEIEVEQALAWAMEIEGPVYFRLGRSPLPQFHDSKYKFSLGKPDVLRQGNDVLIFATGVTVGYALEAAEILEKKNMTAGVVNVPTLKPLEKKGVLDLVKDAKALVTVEDHNIIGGLGSAVLEAIEAEISIPFKRLGLQDTFGVSGKPHHLFSKFGFDGQGIAEACISLLEKKN